MTDTSYIAKTYAALIERGLKSIDNVPERFKTQVQILLNAKGGE